MSYESSDDNTPLVGNTTQSDYGSIASSTAIASEEGENGEDANESNTSRPDLVWILIGLYSAVFLAALDGTVVATLLSSIGSYFGKANQTTYVGTSYMLSMCCFTPLYGRLSDILGRKGAMLLALTLFGCGTAYCGFATSMNTLIAARAVAGMGGGGITTVTSIAVSDLIPLKQRGLYQGITNILFGMGAGLGGPLGGYLNETFGWRSAFIFQIPVLAISYGLVIWKVNIPLPEAVQNQTIQARLRRIDLPGSLTLVGCVGCFLLTFNLTSSEGLEWTSPIIYGLLIFSVMSGCLFVFVEWRWSPFPIMPLRLLCQRNMLSGCIANFVGNAAAFSMIFNVPLYFSSVRMTRAAEAGAHLLPHSVALSAGSVFAGWLMQRTGKLYRLTIASALLSICAHALVSMWGTRTSQIELWLDIVPQGFGMSSLITTTLIAAIAAVAKEDMAVATGITYLFRTTGQVLGVSLSGAVLQEVLSRKLRQRITGPEAAQIIDRIRRNTEDIRLLPADQRLAATASYADALRVVFICQTALAVIMLIACLPIQEQPLPGSREEQEAQEQLRSPSIRSDDAESLLGSRRED